MYGEDQGRSRIVWSGSMLVNVRVQVTEGRLGFTGKMRVDVTGVKAAKNVYTDLFDFAS